MRFIYTLYLDAKVHTGRVDARNASTALEVAMHHTGIPESELQSAVIIPVPPDPTTPLMGCCDEN